MFDITSKYFNILNNKPLEIFLHVIPVRTVVPCFQGVSKLFCHLKIILTEQYTKNRNKIL